MLEPGDFEKSNIRFAGYFRGAKAKVESKFLYIHMYICYHYVFTIDTCRDFSTSDISLVNTCGHVRTCVFNLIFTRHTKTIPNYEQHLPKTSVGYTSEVVKGVQTRNQIWYVSFVRAVRSCDASPREGVAPNGGRLSSKSAPAFRSPCPRPHVVGFCFRIRDAPDR